MRSKSHILNVWIEHQIDEDPDFSTLGEYTDTPEIGAFVRDTGEVITEDTDMDSLPSRGREYRFFVPAMTGEETGNPDSPRRDYERMEAYNRGDWHCIGVIAKAEIVVNGVTQTLRSGGLWGVESDAGSDDLAEVGKEELTALRGILANLSAFGKVALDRAFAKVRQPK
jgi:hypothetical protein